MPSYMWLYIAEIAPRNRPSTTAYAGALIGDHSFLKIVTSASTSPPIRPPHMYGAAPTIPAGVETWLHVNAALNTHSNSSMPVLLTVPLRVMTLPSSRTMAPLPRSRKVDSLRAGLPLRIIGIPLGLL